MNDLTWFLYWTDVLPGFAKGLTVFSVIGVIIVATIGTAFLIETAGDLTTKFYLFTGSLISFFIILGLSTNFIPSKQTMYLMIASEMGEEAYNSPNGQEVTNTLKTILKELIKKDETP